MSGKIQEIPDRLTIKICPGESEGLFIAEIVEPDWITQGESVGDAIAAAAEVVKLMADECKYAHLTHCYCIPGNREGKDGDECCICGTWRMRDADDTEEK